MELFNNILEEMPESLEHLTRLHTLNISYNKFDGMPECVGRMTALTNLQMGFNELTGHVHPIVCSIGKHQHRGWLQRSVSRPPGRLT